MDDATVFVALDARTHRSFPTASLEHGRRAARFFQSPVPAAGQWLAEVGDIHLRYMFSHF